MKWSLYIGKVSGIKLFIHWTFIILIGWIFMLHFRMGHDFHEGMIGVLFILAVFGCVILHELGHAFTVNQEMTTNCYTISPVFENSNLVGVLDKEDINELPLVKQVVTKQLLNQTL